MRSYRRGNNHIQSICLLRITEMPTRLQKPVWCGTLSTQLPTGGFWLFQLLWTNFTPRLHYIIRILLTVMGWRDNWRDEKERKSNCKSEANFSGVLKQAVRNVERKDKWVKIPLCFARKDSLISFFSLWKSPSKMWNILGKTEPKVFKEWVSFHCTSSKAKFWFYSLTIRNKPMN